MIPHFDRRDSEILSRRVFHWNARKGPRVGDYVIMPDATVERFSYDWGKDIQTTPAGAFYLGENGTVSYSGGLNAAIPKANLVLTDETREGQFWFFHHNDSKAHNGVNVKAWCRVFRYDPQMKPGSATPVNHGTNPGRTESDLENGEIYRILP